MSSTRSLSEEGGEWGYLLVRQEERPNQVTSLCRGGETILPHMAKFVVTMAGIIAFTCIFG